MSSVEANPSSDSSAPPFAQRTQLMAIHAICGDVVCVRAGLPSLLMPTSGIPYPDLGPPSPPGRTCPSSPPPSPIAAAAASLPWIDRTRDDPVFAVVIAAGLTLFFAVPITVGAAFAPRCDRSGTSPKAPKRVAAGDYTQRLPVVQDDDLGALSASFNRMQAGLADANACGRRSVPMSIPLSLPGFSTKGTTSSPESALTSP